MNNLISLFSVLFVFGSVASASDSCKGCNEVKKAIFEMKKSKDPSMVSPLQLKTSDAIIKMAGTNGKLTTDQLEVFVEALRASLPRDNSHMMIENTNEIIRANLPELKSALTKIPKAEMNLIETSISGNFDEHENGNDPEAAKQKK